MQSTRIAVSIAALFFASLSVLALAMGAYAQGIGDHKEDEGGIGAKGLADPPPEGFDVLYIFSGARDTQNSITNSGATSVHCSNAGSTNVVVTVEIIDWDNNPTIFGTLTIPPSGSKTFSSQNTAFYSEDFIMVTDDDINQGSGRVLASSGSTNIICTAQVLDPLGNPPNYGVNLTLYDSDGNIVGDVADLSVTKTDGQQILEPGDPIIYKITVTNNGPSAVVSASVQDVIPMELNSATWHCTPGSGASCIAAGTGDIDDQGVDIPSGSSVTYVLTAATSMEFIGVITNTVSVTPPNSITDPVLGNNSATDQSATEGMFMDGFENL